MGRLTTTKVIRDTTDLTKVPFHARDNQHDDERQAVGRRVREYLDNNDLPPEITKKFFNDVRAFYEKMVITMVSKFPFKDTTLHSLSFLKPNLRDTITTEEVASLFKFTSGCLNDRRHLVDEYEEYLIYLLLRMNCQKQIIFRRTGYLSGKMNCQKQIILRRTGCLSGK